MDDKPYSQASENNKTPILEILSRIFSSRHRILEIGSGTGQHGVFFAQHLSQLQWQMSDREENLSGIRQWRSCFPSDNLPEPISLDVRDNNWPAGFDGVFSANTAHIMPWEIVTTMVQKVAECLPKAGLFALYGPFNYEGKHTSDSNRRFDQMLRERGLSQGIRDFEVLNDFASKNGLILLEDNPMPANNRLLVWQKQ